MDPAQIKIGGRYGNDDTLYRVDAISSDGMISATVIRGHGMTRGAIGRRRERFTTLERFARWIEREEPAR